MLSVTVNSKESLGFCLVFFEAGLYYVALAVLEFFKQAMLALNSECELRLKV